MYVCMCACVRIIIYRQPPTEPKQLLGSKHHSFPSTTKTTGQSSVQGSISVVLQSLKLCIPHSGGGMAVSSALTAAAMYIHPSIVLSPQALQPTSNRAQIAMVIKKHIVQCHLWASVGTYYACIQCGMCWCKKREYVWFVAGQGPGRWGCPPLFYPQSGGTLWHRRAASGSMPDALNTHGMLQSKNMYFNLSDQKYRKII